MYLRSTRIVGFLGVEGVLYVNEFITVKAWSLFLLSTSYSPTTL
jgi:hypothetical protein